MSSGKPSPTPWKPGLYPPARRDDHVDVYKSAKHGEVKVHDPYVWLETPNDEQRTWINDQVAMTNEYLDRIPERSKLKDILMQNINFPRFGPPAFKGDKRWYWYYNTGLQAQSVLYRSKDERLPDFSQKDDGPGGEVFFDPNLLSKDGTSAFAVTAFSPDGKYFAYGISVAGSDSFTIYVRKTTEPFRQEGDDRPDHQASDILRYVKFSSIEWTYDNKGFFYQRFPDRESHGELNSGKAGTETNKDLNAMICYHRLGTPQAEDILVWKDDENPEWLFGTQVTKSDDGKYLALYISKDTARQHKLWIADLTQNDIGPDIKWIKLVDDFEADFTILGNDGTKFYLQTTKDAPRDKVVSVNIADSKPTFVDVIPEDPEANIESAVIAGDHFIVTYTRNVQDELYLYSKSGERLQRLLPNFVGSIGVSAKENESWFFVTATGFTTPGTIYHYDFKAQDQKGLQLFRDTQVKGIKADDFIAHQEWCTSKDGTRIPMFIVRPKGVEKDGTAPAILYGYGGFSYSITPSFSATKLTTIKSYGMISVIANIRGGAEFGEEWHLAGTKERKHNVFDDFIAVAEHLTKTGWAAPGKIAINGASNGGLLVAACLNRAPPGTFGAAVAEVGVLDMLKFADFTIGEAWTADYGNPHKPDEFDYIYPISPLHNVPDQEFPPTLLMTADHDDRVVPLHTFKHAATLQHTLSKNPHPLLVRIETSAGHGAGKSTEKIIQEAADKWSFVAYSMGVPWKDSESRPAKDEL